MLSDLTPPQRELAEYMALLSEAAFNAGWIEGLEGALWKAMTDGPFKYGRLALTHEHVRRLAQLSHTCGGWIVFDATQEETFVPLADWIRMTESA